MSYWQRQHAATRKHQVGRRQRVLGEAYSGEVVGLEAVDDGLWHVRLGRLRVGALHERSVTIVPLEGGVTNVPGCTAGVAVCSLRGERLAGGPGAVADRKSEAR